MNNVQWMTTTTIIDHAEVRLNAIHNLSLVFFFVALSEQSTQYCCAHDTFVTVHSIHEFLIHVHCVHALRHVENKFSFMFVQRVKRYDRHTLIFCFHQFGITIYSLQRLESWPAFEIKLTDTDWPVCSKGKEDFVRKYVNLRKQLIGLNDSNRVLKTLNVLFMLFKQSTKTNTFSTLHCIFMTIYIFKSHRLNLTLEIEKWVFKITKIDFFPKKKIICFWLRSVENKGWFSKLSFWLFLYKKMIFSQQQLVNDFISKCVENITFGIHKLIEIPVHLTFSPLKSY